MSKINETRRADCAAGVRNVNFLAGVNFRDSSTKPYAVQAARSGATRRIDFDAINRAALAALPAILARLLPGGKTVAGEYNALNPTRADRRAGSFKINLRSGRWADFAVGDRGGDPESLAAYVERVSQPEAARRLARTLGVKFEGARHD